ncbi:Polysaccharide biosynthesis/export protein [compost metagenome]
MVRKILLLFIVVSILSSCSSREKIVYFQNISEMNNENIVKYEPKLKPDDLLMIIVSAPDSEAAAPFNLPAVGVSGTNGGVDMVNPQLRYQTYLINNDGDIQFPVIGNLKLGGLTRSEALTKLNAELKKYINNPVVNMRILNYKVSVFGEVARPGTFEIATERITLPEALSRAGDMSIYGNRHNILVIREIDGKKTHNFVDITKADFINSPFYYLSQNDLVYVEPNKTKINSSVVGPNTSVIISSVSLLITLIALLAR